MLSSVGMKKEDDPLMAKRFSLLRTVEIITDCFFKRVEFETDNKSLAEMMNNSE